MTAVRVSAARARQLGLPGVEAATKTRQRPKRDRAAVPSADCAPNVCHTCGVRLERPVDEDRHHTTNPTHRRYESSLTWRRPAGLPIWWCNHCRRYSHSLLTHVCGRRQP